MLKKYKKPVLWAIGLFVIPIIFAGLIFEIGSTPWIISIFISIPVNWLFYLMKMDGGEHLHPFKWLAKPAVVMVLFFIPLNSILLNMSRDHIREISEFRNAKQISSLDEIKDTLVYRYVLKDKPDISVGEIWRENKRSESLRRRNRGMTTTTTFFVTPLPVDGGMEKFLGCRYGHGLLSISPETIKEELLKDEIYIRLSKDKNFSNAAYTYRKGRIKPYDFKSKFYVYEVLYPGLSLKRTLLMFAVFFWVSTGSFFTVMFFSIRKYERTIKNQE